MSCDVGEVTERLENELSLILTFRPIYNIIVITVLCPLQTETADCRLRHKGCSSAQRQVFHRKLKKQGCNFTRDEYVR